jgi:hypothetical protein
MMDRLSLDQLPLDVVRSLAARAWLYPEIVIGAVAGAMLLLTVLLVARRRRRGPISRKVVSLARGGHAPAVIARRTGLSRDAVAMALHVGGNRPILPEPARIAGANDRPTSFVDAMQVASSNPLTELPDEWSRPARALPPRWARLLPLRNRTTAWASSTE